MKSIVLGFYYEIYGYFAIAWRKQSSLEAVREVGVK
jgi:hypothetical protein